MKNLGQRSLLEIMEAHPETETLFRRHDEALGACVVCTRLFETPEGLEENEPLVFKGLLRALEDMLQE